MIANSSTLLRSKLMAGGNDALVNHLFERIRRYGNLFYGLVVLSVVKSVKAVRIFIIQATMAGSVDEQLR